MKGAIIAGRETANGMGAMVVLRCHARNPGICRHMQEPRSLTSFGMTKAVRESRKRHDANLRREWNGDVDCRLIGRHCVDPLLGGLCGGFSKGRISSTDNDTVDRSLGETTSCRRTVPPI